MQLKISLKLLLFVVGMAGIIFFVIIIIFPTPGLSGRSFYIKPTLIISGQAPQSLIDDKPAELVPSAEQAISGLPIRIKIPSINVDAAIEYVGLTSQGAMDIPKSPDNVAWFNIGPRPGENGSAVIAGHYGIKNGKASVFDNLYKLRKGDKLYIEDEKGATIVFTVRESRRYDSNADASDVFGSNDGKPHLNLITCEGVWNKAAKTYSQRLVVFTDKE